jgi:hypothetical protein
VGPVQALPITIAVLAGVLIAAQPTPSHAYDLFGSDLGFCGSQSTPDACNAACNGNPSCQAWTLVLPPASGSAMCCLKSAVPPPSLNSTCTSNSVCVSGAKRSDGWCGESPGATFGPNQILGQGQVLSCPATQTCRARVTQGAEQICWFIFPPFLVFPYPCHGPDIQSTDWFCQ